MSNREFLSCLVGPIALGASIASGGTILHVDDDAPPAGDGLSWATAYRFLQDAMVAADNDAGINEIRVAQGLYTPDRDEAHPDGASDCYTPHGGTGCNDPDCEATVCKQLPFCCDIEWDVDCAAAASRLCVDPRLPTFRLVNGVELLGGYAGIGEPNPDDRDVALYETFLSGDVTGNDGPGPFDNNGENSYHVVIGSGTDQTAVIDGFTISGGNADGAEFEGAGGGMLNLNGSPTVTNCMFSENTALFGGGGMINIPGNPTVSNCTFSGNAADAGGGMLNMDSSLTVTNCTFSRNSVCDGGGGMANFTSSLTVTNCTFSGNLGGDMGGGGMRSEASSTTVTNCTFSGNTVIDMGGGGGMANFNSSSTVTNCILWNNSPDELFDTGTPAVAYSNIQGGWRGTGNIDADPLFVDPANSDYHLLPGSPCIDAGDNTAVPVGITTDLDGDPRFADDLATTDTGNGECPVVDMGSYEFPSSCPWDLDCDANVGITDFLAVLAAWGTDPGGPPDFDGDGTVGINDFLTLLANWGACP